MIPVIVTNKNIQEQLPSLQAQYENRTSEILISLTSKEYRPETAF